MKKSFLLPAPMRLCRSWAAVFALAGAAPAHAVQAEVIWSDAKCDFVLTRNEDGHGIVLKASPFDLKPGDVLDGAIDQVGYFRRIAKLSSGETSMMRGMKYGIRRKEAVDLIMDWSRLCDPPLK